MELFDGFVTLSQGMNGFMSPALINEAAVAKGINVSFRNHLVRTRPALEEYVALPPGVFQGAGLWSLESGDRLVFVVSGGVHVLDVDTKVITGMGSLLASGRQCYFVQVDRYLVIQDGQSNPVVLEDADGTPVVYSGTVSIPPGYMMTYAHGRLHLVPVTVPSTEVAGRPYLISGDILQPWDPPTGLRFIENDYLSEGGAHGLPAEMGFIGGLGSLRNSQTGTGVGATVVLARNGACAFDFSIPRDLWKSQALSQALFLGAGCVSPWSVVNVNDDLVYRSQDGVRTIKYTIGQAAGSGGALSNQPMSHQVREWLAGDSAYLTRASSAFNDHRLLFTVSGKADGVFRGLVSWDVFSQPLYDGLWTGDDFTQVLAAQMARNPSMFVFADGPRLYRVNPDGTEDTILGATDGTRIESRIETRSFSLGDLVTLKKLEYVELWLSGMVHDVGVKVWFRPHGYAKWFELGSKSIAVPDGSLPQSRRRVRISLDNFAAFCDPVTNESPYNATAMQFAVQWTGRATVERFRVAATAVLEAPPEPCFADSGMLSAADSTSGDELDDFSYQIRE